MLSLVALIAAQKLAYTADFLCPCSGKSKFSLAGITLDRVLSDGMKY